MSILILPLDFDANGLPKDRILFDAMQKFCTDEFGRPRDFRGASKTWAVVEVSEQGEGYEVIAGGTLAFAIDCPFFHIKRPADDAADQDFEKARHVRDLLVTRMAAYVQDNTGPNTEVMVFIAPEQQRFWASYLRMLKAKPSNRFIVKV
jgi:hypothetical protein